MVLRVAVRSRMGSERRSLRGWSGRPVQARPTRRRRRSGAAGLGESELARGAEWLRRICRQASALLGSVLRYGKVGVSGWYKERARGREGVEHWNGWRWMKCCHCHGYPCSREVTLRMSA